MASSLENVSSDWVAVEVSAVAVVVPQCACRREIAALAAYDRLGRELIRRARLRGLDMPRRGRRQERSSRGGHTREGRGDHGAMATGVPLARRAPYWAEPAGCGRLARIRAVIVRTASGSLCVAPWPAAAEALLSS